MYLSTDAKIVKAAAGATAATTDVTTGAIDTAGYDSVTFLTSLATAASGNYATAQQGAASDGSDLADIAGSKTINANNAAALVLAVVKPTARYVQLTLKRGTSSASGDVWAILGKAHSGPTTNAGTNQTVTNLVSPSTGTP